MPSAGQLRAKVQFQRRARTAGDGAGNYEGPWIALFAPRYARLTPRSTGGAEAVIDARLQGRAIWDCWVRFDSETSAVSTDDRLVDAHDARRVFNIRFAEDMDGRRRWMLFQLEQGVAT